MAVFGGLMLINQPHIIVLGFLIVSLIVLAAGIFSEQETGRDWITIIVGTGMSALSAFTLFWIYLNPPVRPTTPDIVKGYNKMNEQEFLHQVSVDTDVSDSHYGTCVVRSSLKMNFPARLARRNRCHLVPSGAIHHYQWSNHSP